MMAVNLKYNIAQHKSKCSSERCQVMILAYDFRPAEQERQKSGKSYRDGMRGSDYYVKV